MFEPGTDDPIALFRDWFAAAMQAEPDDPNAMTLATVGADGRPSARIVLLKGVDERGFVFFTNMNSRKGCEIAGNASVALCFHWKSLDRQVRVEGTASPVEDADADAYFAGRSRDSQIGAWASRQSQPLASRAALMDAVRDYHRRFEGGPVPRPDYWTGTRVSPQRIEFWQNGDHRLHDRFVFARSATDHSWTVTRLNP